LFGVIVVLHVIRQSRAKGSNSQLSAVRTFRKKTIITHSEDLQVIECLNSKIHTKKSQKLPAKLIQGSGCYSPPTFDNSGMNYQQRNRALSECIRERCERTGYNPIVPSEHDVAFTPNLLF
jgi:hypothetical protein